ncbi:MAG: glycoside hydrolase family 15 protein [Sedimentisphaerales bacterium]|nr:glycoside hydrolase family 15 protein [Sedimentisphaerales bacterium]
MKSLHLKKLIQTSREVIKDSSLQNGAIVAADSDKSIYPSNVQDYRRIWVRDASYICMAADILGLKEIPEAFFDWCMNRAEGFSQTGIFYNAYNVNGTICGTMVPPVDVRVSQKVRKRYTHLTHHGTQFQPDQSGVLLLAISHHIECIGADTSKFEKLIERTASGISNVWKKDRFILPYFDLWEERVIFPVQRRHHIYSLAICIAGLRTAVELLGRRKKWLQTEKEMTAVFNRMYSCNANMIPRTYSAKKTVKNDKITRDDYRPDASLLGLVFPANILSPLDKKMKATVDSMIKKNTVNNGGLLRYPGDKYCGGVRQGWVTLTGAGAWPLLNFWASIYYSLCDDKENAKKYFNWSLERIGEYIPEQIFKSNKKLSVSPLVWSHSMFVIAARFLGYL